LKNLPLLLLLLDVVVANERDDVERSAKEVVPLAAVLVMRYFPSRINNSSSIIAVKPANAQKSSRGFSKKFPIVLQKSAQPRISLRDIERNHKRNIMDEDVLPHPRSLVALVTEDDREEDFEDVARSLSSSSNPLHVLDADERFLFSSSSPKDNDDAHNLFLRITKAHEWIFARANARPSVAIYFLNVNDVIDAPSPNAYAREAQKIERLKARCKEKRVGLMFCAVSRRRRRRDEDTSGGGEEEEEKEDVTYALSERVLAVLTRLAGGSGSEYASSASSASLATRIVSLTRRGSDSREKCLKQLARATEEVMQEVLVNEAKRAIGKCDEIASAFERDVLESGDVVDEREVRLGRLEARCKASRYLFKAASYAEFRGDTEAAMNALSECYERLVTYADEALPEVLRSFKENSNTANYDDHARRRLWRVCETLRVLTYCRSRMSSMQLSQIVKTMDTNANIEVNKAIQELARVEKEHASFVKRCLPMKRNESLLPMNARDDLGLLKCFAAYRLTLRAKADKSFADVLAHTLHANPNVYDAIFNDNSQFQRTSAAKSTCFDLRLDPGFYYQSAFEALASRREFLQSSGLGKNLSVESTTNQVALAHGRFLGTFEDKSKTITGTGQNYVENHGAGNAQIPSIELGRAYARYENTFSPLEMLEKAKAYYEGNPRYGSFRRLLTVVSSDYALELFYANNTATNKEKVLHILTACAETYRKEGWTDLLEETLERTLVCLEKDDVETATQRVHVLLELHGIEYSRGGDRGGETRASRLLADGGAMKTQSSSPVVFEISRDSLASHAFRASCSFSHDASRNDAVRAGDCVTLAVRYALKGLTGHDAFSVAQIEAHFSDGTKATTTTSATRDGINDDVVVYIPFTAQSKTQSDFVLEVDALDVLTKSGITFRFPKASLEMLKLVGHTKSVSVKELAPRAELAITSEGNDAKETTVLFGEKKTLAVVVTAVDGLADAIVNLSIDESLQEVSLGGEDDGVEKRGEVTASFENPRIVVGSLSKGETKRVDVNATFFSNRDKNRKKSRATISAHLTCNFGSPELEGEVEVSPSRRRVVAAETSKTFTFTDALEVLDSKIFAPCGTSPVSILIEKNVEDDTAENIDFNAQNKSLMNEGDVRLTNVRAKTSGLVVVDDEITTRLNPGDVYTQMATDENVQSVSWHRKDDARTPVSPNSTSFLSTDLLGDVGRRVEVMNICARVPEFIQVGVAFEYVVEMKNLDLNVPRDFMVAVKDAPGFVMAGESKTTKTANPGESCFLRLKIVAVASGERFLPLVSIACPKLSATWTNTQQQSVLVLPAAL